VPLKKTFLAGDGLQKLPHGWLNKVAYILDDTEGEGITILRTESGRGWKIKPTVDDSTIEIAGTGNRALQVKDGGIVEAKLGALAVTEGKIGALAVTEGKIGALAVTEGKLGALAVATAKIAANAVTSDKTTGATQAAFDTSLPGTELTIVNGLVTVVTTP